MSLCGAGQACGCVIKQAAASAGGINSQFPTIAVDGGGGIDNPWEVSLDSNWVDPVTDLINNSLPPFPYVPWIPMTLINGWTNYQDQFGGFTWARASYRKIGDIVYVRGLINKTGGVSNEIVFVFPVGYRPPAQIIFAGDLNANAHLRAEVSANGNFAMVWSAPGDSAYVSISTVFFSTTV